MLPATLTIVLTAVLFNLCSGQVVQAATSERVSRPFDEKVTELRVPLAAFERPLAARRAVLPKSAVQLDPGPDHRLDRLVVKFAEEYRVRLRDGRLTELAGRSLAGVAAAETMPGVDRVERLFTRPEDHLDRDRAFAIERSGVRVADLNNYYLVYLTPGAEPAAVATGWLGLDVVEIAYFEGLATEACTDILPATPDFVASQNYLEPAPTGVDAPAAWLFHPAGQGVPDFWFIDVERGWNVDHEDFGDVAILNGAPYPSSINHGTAVLGEIVGCDSDFGVTGIANGVTARMVNFSNEGSVADAFDLAASYLDPGEVYLIEIHTSGPGPIPGQVCQCNCGQFGYVPMEWGQANFDAIQTHTMAGIIVVEAGGNGGMDLDDPWYNNLFDRGYRDSGAIMVGAGTSSGHGPECWTNFGSRIDCQGYGSNVVSTGYGGLFNPGDENQWYTATFSGTSSASPIVTGCAIAIQNITQQAFGFTLDPFSMRGALSLFGTPQGSPPEKHIGVLPDLGALLDGWFRTTIDHTPLPDTTNEIDDYEVTAVVTPALFNGAIDAVTLHYSVSGASWASAAMSPGGGASAWQGFIPAQERGNYLLYYLEATPTFGPPTLFPLAGETEPLLFVVGSMVQVVTDDLEAPSSWVVGAPDDDATSGIWERGDPHGTDVAGFVVAPEDDHTAAPGVMAFVTGNPGPGAAAADGDVDDGKTTLFSPVFDLSAENYVRISAWTWTRFLSDDLFRIDISNDGGLNWLPLVEITIDIDAWQFFEQELRREVVPYTSTMQLRFVASDYGGQSLVEGGVDDLVISGLRQPSEGMRLPAPVAPRRLALGPASPNPFRPSTRFSYTLPATGEVRLAVYDVTGRLVRSLARGEVLAGTHVIRWDGRNDGGRRVAPGVYYLRLEAGGERQSRSLVMLR